ncbi:MAG: hypothetical protein NTY53_00905 [Kiritimatiellaeota bacterium]|nr:hypothetical protein [Kiritimatiellota bacterium]
MNSTRRRDGCYKRRVHLESPVDPSGKPHQQLPGWLKWFFTFFLLLWLPAMLRAYGLQNMLWFCELGNVLLVLGLWLESRLLLSALLVGLLLVDLGWTLDLAIALATGLHPFAATAYMFEPALSLPMRLGSLFHLTVPAALVFAVVRLGYDGRGFWLQTIFTAAVLWVSYLATTPATNVNWVWGPGCCAPQTAVSAPVYLLGCLLAYPLALYLPVHLAAARWLKKT